VGTCAPPGSATRSTTSASPNSSGARCGCGEGGYAWSEHFLDDGRGRRTWLSVEEDPDLEVVLWRELPDSGLVPSERELVVDDTTYRQVEHGQARYTGEGTTGLGDAGTSGAVEYVDYDGRRAGTCRSSGSTAAGGRSASARRCC
jgi:hypothetical protein